MRILVTACFACISVNTQATYAQSHFSKANEDNLRVTSSSGGALPDYSAREATVAEILAKLDRIPLPSPSSTDGSRVVALYNGNKISETELRELYAELWARSFVERVAYLSEEVGKKQACGLPYSEEDKKITYHMNRASVVLNGYENYYDTIKTYLHERIDTTRKANLGKLSKIDCMELR